MNIKKNYLVYFSNYKYKLRLNLQFYVRKFIELIINFKKVLNIFLIANKNFLFKWIVFHISKEISSLWHFLDKVFKFKYLPIFSSKIFQFSLFKIDLIIDNWIEKSKYNTILCEVIDKINYKFFSKQLQLFLHQNPNLIFKNEKNIFLTLFNFKYIVTIKKWIFKKFYNFPSWFFIKFYQNNKNCYIIENFKIKKKKIS